MPAATSKEPSRRFPPSPVVVWAGAEPAARPNPAEVASLVFLPLADLDVEPRFVRIRSPSAP